MTNPWLAISLSAVLLLACTGCGEKKDESSSNQLPENHTSLSQGAAAESTLLIRDSVDERGRPLPPLPIEEMSRAQLTEYKKLLTEKGFYTCCIEPSCRMCLFEFEECPCQHNVKKNEGVCGECYEGWQVGKGNLRGVKSQDIKKLDE
ncbi:MAG: hypothetical protein L0Y80_02235 [Ignavibacteriae bacterium]|nr:hypothetical protein [Ignavibacteriota bacterium]